MINANYFGEVLCLIRKSKGLTQKALGEMVGTQPSNIAAYEQGVNRPSLDFACRIANVLGVGLDVFIDEDSPCVKFLKEKAELERKYGGVYE